MTDEQTRRQIALVLRRVYGLGPDSLPSILVIYFI